jgi:hypothetical protein
MRIAFALIVALSAGLAFGKLPPPTDEAKAKAAEVAAKSAWDDKIALYKLCLAMDRTAAAYRKSQNGSGAAALTMTAPCVDPGPYVSQAQITPSTSKPQEASGAHSPPGAAISPPSTNTTTAQMPKGGQQ